VLLTNIFEKILLSHSVDPMDMIKTCHTGYQTQTLLRSDVKSTVSGVSQHTGYEVHRADRSVHC